MLQLHCELAASAAKLMVCSCSICVHLLAWPLRAKPACKLMHPPTTGSRICGIESVRCVMVQLDEAKKQLDTRQKTRAREGSKLRSALTNLEAQAAADAQQVVSAQQAHEELLKDLPSYLSPSSHHSPHPPSLAPPKCHVGRPAPADATQAPALAALPSLSAMPHLQKCALKPMPSHVATQVRSPDLQGVSSAAAKSALCMAPMGMAPNATSASAREILLTAWHPTFLQQASAATAQNRRAYTVLEQSAQLAALPQGVYSAQWLAATSAQASMLQQRQAAAREGPQPALKRSKLSSASNKAGCLSRSAVGVTARNASMKKRAEATAGTNNHILLPAGPETLQEGMGSLTQQGGISTQQVGRKSQQRGYVTQQAGSMTQQKGYVTQQAGSMTQQGGCTNQEMGSITQQRGWTPHHMGSMTQQAGSMAQQPPSLPLPWGRTATAVQNPAAPSATLSAQAAQLPPAATSTSNTGQPRFILPPAAARTRAPVPVTQLGQASPGRRHKAPVPIQAKPLQSQQCPALPKSTTLASPCQPAVALTAAGTPSAVAPCAGSLSNRSPAPPVATALVTPVTAASQPAAPCLAGPGMSSMQAIASQQQLFSGLPAKATSGQACTTHEVSHQEKAPPSTYHLQAPTCSLAAASASASASASSMKPVSAVCGLSSTVHPNFAYSPGHQMLPSQHALAQELVDQSSAAQRVATVTSAGITASVQASRVQSNVAQISGAHGSCPQFPAPQILSSSRAHACQSVHSSCNSNRAATSNPPESHTESTPTACTSPQLLAPGLPAELMALFNQSAVCTPHVSSSLLPCSRPSHKVPNMQSPVQSASWQTRDSIKSIMPDDTRRDDVHSQQHAKIMLGGMY